MGWPVSRPRILLSPSPQFQITGACSLTWLLHGCWELTSRPHACVTSPLHTFCWFACLLLRQVLMQQRICHWDGGALELLILLPPSVNVQRWDGTQGFLHARQVLDQPHYNPSPSPTSIASSNPLCQALFFTGRSTERQLTPGSCCLPSCGFDEPFRSPS